MLPVIGASGTRYRLLHQRAAEIIRSRLQAALRQLRAELQARVVAEMGKPLRPREIRFVSDLPKTRNAKVMRRIIRAAFLGEDPGDTASLVNPEAVEEIRRAV